MLPQNESISYSEAFLAQSRGTARNYEKSQEICTHGPMQLRVASWFALYALSYIFHNKVDETQSIQTP